MRFYIALEDMDLDWKYDQVAKFDELWKNGYSLEYIAKKFKRDIDEVALLLIDRSRQGYVGPRTIGLG